jgi:exodeoxyribonuclease VII small subunit
MSEPQKVSFEQGLERLEQIAEQLGESELSVEETIALLRDGKGLEQALRAYLETAEKDLLEIEQGKGLTEFVIERPDAAS